MKEIFTETTLLPGMSVLLFSIINLHFVIHIFHRSVHEIWRHSFIFVTVLKWDPRAAQRVELKPVFLIPKQVGRGSGNLVVRHRRLIQNQVRSRQGQQQVISPQIQHWNASIIPATFWIKSLSVSAAPAATLMQAWPIRNAEQEGGPPQQTTFHIRILYTSQNLRFEFVQQLSDTVLKTKNYRYGLKLCVCLWIHYIVTS